MTARDRYHRARGYARAGKRWADAARRGDPSDPDRRAVLAELDRREGFAWRRLPENARRQIARPA